MLWHKGDVYDAVNKVTESQSHLFVSIRGKTEIGIISPISSTHVSDETTPQIYTDMLEKSSKLHKVLKHSICNSATTLSIFYRSSVKLQAWISWKIALNTNSLLPFTQWEMFPLFSSSRISVKSSRRSRMPSMKTLFAANCRRYSA